MYNYKNMSKQAMIYNIKVLIKAQSGYGDNFSKVIKLVKVFLSFSVRLNLTMRASDQISSH